MAEPSGIDFIGMCFGVFKLCISKENIKTEQYLDLMGEVMNFDDKEGEFDPVNQEAVDGQWINLAWNGGSDPTKIPFPFWLIIHFFEFYYWAIISLNINITHQIKDFVNYY